MFTDPKPLEGFQGAVASRGSDVIISKQDFEKYSDILQAYHDRWQLYIQNWVKEYSTPGFLKGWMSDAQRGTFRLMLLMAVVAIDRRERIAGKHLVKTNLGGNIKKILLEYSRKTMDVKAGSLYVALDAFEDRGLFQKDPNAPEHEQALVISTAAKEAIVSCLKILIMFTKVLKEKTDFITIASEPVSNWIREKLKGTLTLPPQSPSIQQILKDAEEFGNQKEFLFTTLGLDHDVDGKGNILGDWQSDFNRGMVDVFILSQLLKGPSYGKKIMDDAAESMGFQAGTLYPKIARLLDDGLIEGIDDEKKIDVKVNLEPEKKRGPHKNYYDITVKGALHLATISSLLLEQLGTLFNLVRELVRTKDLAAPKGP